MTQNNYVYNLTRTIRAISMEGNCPTINKFVSPLSSLCTRMQRGQISYEMAYRSLVTQRSASELRRLVETEVLSEQWLKALK